MGILYQILRADAKKFLAPMATAKQGSCGAAPTECSFYRDGQFPCESCPNES